MKNIIVYIICILAVLSFTIIAISSYEPVYYTVQPGDSLWFISVNHGIPIHKLQSLNPSIGSVIYPGQSITVGYKKTTSGIQYVVQSGDTLWSISQRYRVSIDNIQRWNNISGDLIYPNQVLTLYPNYIITFTDQEFELLARVIAAEARGEPYNGQVAVGAVIINRVLSSSFPNTISGVIHQRNQFEPVTTGAIWSITPSTVQYQAAREALKGVSPVDHALFFYNPRTATSRWIANNKTYVITIANHEFRV